MRINTNMAALNAWRTMTNNSGNLQKSLERLASGYRLNRAADDAAGLAVSEKMSAQIRGLGMATRNTQDAISLVQTAEGGASKVQEMMQRMRELAVQAGSDTLQDSDRAKLQEEFASLQAEVDRTTDTVTFNGRKLINGEAGDLSKLTAGDEVASARVVSTMKAAGIFNVNVTQAAREQKQLEVATDDTGVAVSWDTSSTMDDLFKNGGASGAFASGDTITFAQDGKSIAIDLNAVKGYTAGQFVDHVNTKAQDAGMAMRMKYNGGLEIESNVDGVYGDVAVAHTIADAQITFAFSTGGGGQASQDALATITNAADGTTVATSDYTVKGNVFTGKANTALQGVEFTAAGTTAGTASTLELSRNSLSFQVGANTGEAIATSFGNLTIKNLAIDTISIGDRSSAGTALTKIDAALSTVSTERSKMGAMQNRLENTIANLQTQSENLTAANSRIRDLDMASEMAQFTKFQILSQASTAMLAQANQITQGVLSLLR